MLTAATAKPITMPQNITLEECMVLAYVYENTRDLGPTGTVPYQQVVSHFEQRKDGRGFAAFYALDRLLEYHKPPLLLFPHDGNAISRERRLHESLFFNPRVIYDQLAKLEAAANIAAEKRWKAPKLPDPKDQAPAAAAAGVVRPLQPGDIVPLGDKLVVYKGLSKKGQPIFAAVDPAAPGEDPSADDPEGDPAPATGTRKAEPTSDHDAG